MQINNQGRASVLACMGTDERLPKQATSHSAFACLLAGAAQLQICASQMFRVSITRSPGTPCNLLTFTFRQSITNVSRVFCSVIQTPELIQKEQFFRMDRSLTPQAFASNNLDRSITDRRNKDFLTVVFPESLFLVVSTGKVLVSRTRGTELRWFNASELGNLGYKAESDVLQRRAGTMCWWQLNHPWLDHSQSLSGLLLHICAVMCADEKDLNPYLLGQEQDTKEWKFVLSLSGDQLNPFAAGQDVELVDLRTLMADLSVGDLAIAGHAVALSQWHQVCILPM